MPGGEQAETPLPRQLAAEFERRVIVDLLAADRGRAHNVHVLRAGLEATAKGVGIAVAPRVEEAEAAVRWLAREKLVEIVSEEPIAARATDRGIAVSEGGLVVPGVAAAPGE